jgi:hypothetical protein
VKRGSGEECGESSACVDWSHVLYMQVQWLFPGFTNADLQQATETASQIMKVSDIERLRTARAHQHQHQASGDRDCEGDSGEHEQRKGQRRSSGSRNSRSRL